MAKGGETPPRQVSRQLGGAHWATWVLVGPEKAGGRQNWFNVGQWVQWEVCAVCAVCSVKCVRCVQCVDMHGLDMFFGMAVWAIIYCVLQVGKKVAHALLCNIRDSCALCKARLTPGLDLKEILARVRSHCQENERSGHINAKDRKHISEESLVPVQDICKGYTVSVTLLANRSDNLSWRS